MLQARSNSGNFMKAGIPAVDQGTANYYHFLIHQLPFIVVASRLYPEADLIIVNFASSFMHEYLELFGISQSFFHFVIQPCLGKVYYNQSILDE